MWAGGVLNAFCTINVLCRHRMIHGFIHPIRSMYSHAERSYGYHGVHDTPCKACQ